MVTVSDAMSRFLPLCDIMVPTTQGVWPACGCLQSTASLARCGWKTARRSVARRGGVTKLPVKWVKLRIALESITPGCPQQNGRHERMHPILKQETSRPPAGTGAQQKARFDASGNEFNDVHPHVALGQQT